MVNMFTCSMMPMGMYGAPFQGTNVPQMMKAKYGNGPEDFGTRPYAQPYPMAVIPMPQESPIKETWLARFIKKCWG